MQSLARTKPKPAVAGRKMFRYYFGIALIASGFVTIILGLMLQN